MFKLCMFCCLLRFIFAQRYKYLTAYQFKCLSSDVTDIFHPNIKARIASGVFLNTRAQRAWLCRPLVLAVLDPQHPPLPGLWSPKRRGPLPTASPRSSLPSLFPDLLMSPSPRGRAGGALRAGTTCPGALAALRLAPRTPVWLGIGSAVRLKGGLESRTPQTEGSQGSAASRRACDSHPVRHGPAAPGILPSVPAPGWLHPSQPGTRQV